MVEILSTIYKYSCSNTGSIRDDPYWTSRRNNLELIELSSINEISLGQVYSCAKTEVILTGNLGTIV